MARTIRECICNSTKETSDGIIPIALGGFITSMSILLLVDSCERLKIDVSDVSMNGERIPGKSKIKPTLGDCIAILNRNDLIRGLGQNNQLQSFLEWVMDENEPNGDENNESDEFISWWDLEYLSQKWNEYASKARCNSRSSRGI